MQPSSRYQFKLAFLRLDVYKRQPEIRYQLARAVKMRHVPELHFHYDESVVRGERIDTLLRDVRASDDAD